MTDDKWRKVRPHYMLIKDGVRAVWAWDRWSIYLVGPKHRHFWAWAPYVVAVRGKGIRCHAKTLPGAKDAARRMHDKPLKIVDLEHV
jgi:hypothetical protein